MNFFIILVRGISLNQVKRGDFPLPLRGGIGIFGFAVLDTFWIGFSVLVFNAVCGFFVF